MYDSILYESVTQCNYKEIVRTALKMWYTALFKTDKYLCIKSCD